MNPTLRKQFHGFLNTPQIWTQPGAFPYAPYTIDPPKVTDPPVDLHIPPTMVLGKRMEEFFKYYISHYTSEQILVHGQQVITKERTLGELDFLLQDPQTQKVSHVELVYKFYVYDPAIPDEAQRWTGPNHRDNLNRKSRHLMDKQFPLLHRKETKRILHSLGLNPAHIEQKVCFKSNFFLPWNTRDRDPGSFSGFSIQGHWIRRAEFRGGIFKRATYFSPKKPDWPILPEHNTQWIPYEDLLDQVDRMLERSQSPLVWMKTPDNRFSRFFIVWW